MALVKIQRLERSRIEKPACIIDGESQRAIELRSADLPRNHALVALIQGVVLVIELQLARRTQIAFTFWAWTMLGTKSSRAAAVAENTRM